MPVDLALRSSARSGCAVCSRVAHPACLDISRREKPHCLQNVRFQGRLDMAQLGFVREEPTKTRLRWRCPAIFGEQQSKTNKRCPAFPNIAFSYLLPARFVTGCAGGGPYTRTTRIYFLGAMASLADLAR